MYSPEVDVGFGASIATPYSLAGHASTFEVGGCFRNEHKFVNQNTQNFTPTASGENASPAMTNFLNDLQDPNYYGGAYQFGPTVEYDKVRTFAAVDAGIRWAAQSITATTRVVPRIGFVWNPAKNGRTSVSGGDWGFL